jgi:modulator of FtsH protease HflK
MDRQDFRVYNFRPNPRQWRAVALAVGALIGLLLLATLWFTIKPEEVGIVLRFGKFVREGQPGLNLKLPFPVERVIKVPVQRQLKEEFGFRTELVGTRTRYSGRDFQDESLMLTGDLNVATVEWTTQFRIRDPYQYLFRVRNVLKTFRDMNEAVMREVIGDRSVNEILTVGRQELIDDAQQRLQELCDQYENGIAVVQIVLQDVNPPDPVKPSFNEVNQAQQERERMINEARSEYNRVIPRAQGEARQVIEQAEGYATNRVNRALGDAELFQEIQAAYRQAPEVTRQRMYLETMGEIYPKVKRKIVVDEKVRGILPLLQLDGEAKR